jgi:hypothetical protein
MDWDGLIQFADSHSLSPLIYSRLQGDEELWAAVPASVQDQLLQRYRYSAHRNLQIYFQFLKLLRKIKQRNIPVILLKGAFLAYVVYGDRALRPMADVDILVKRDDIAGVEGMLQAMGYQLSKWKHRDWCLQNHYHLSYVHPELGVSIEVHWHIQRPEALYPIAIDELWQHACPITIAGVEVTALSLEHLLLYQCLHIAKHSFGLGLRHFYDLAAILEHYHEQIDWLKVKAGANHWHIAKAVYLSLYFTSEFFRGAAHPAMEALKPASLDLEVVETARGQILTSGSSSARLSSEFLQLWEGQYDQNKVPQLLRRVFLPRDLMASVYHLSPNSWHVYLYYPVRIFDLVLRYPQIIRQFLRRDQAMLSWAEQSNKVEMLRKWLAT